MMRAIFRVAPIRIAVCAITVACAYQLVLRKAARLRRMHRGKRRRQN